MGNGNGLIHTGDTVYVIATCRDAWQRASGACYFYENGGCPYKDSGRLSNCGESGNVPDIFAVKVQAVNDETMVLQGITFGGFIFDEFVSVHEIGKRIFTDRAEAEKALVRFEEEKKEKEGKMMIEFVCSKVILQNAINVTGRAVSPKSSIPALEGLLLDVKDHVTISAYNMTTGIRTVIPADINEPGEIVLNARLFRDIIHRMPDGDVKISVDSNNKAHIHCGDTDFDIMGIAPDDFPELPAVEEESAFTIRQNLLRDMIDQTSFSISTNESRPIHTGALFEVENGSLTVVAVDGFRLAVRREKLEAVPTGAFSFVTPGTALNEVKNICGDSEDPAAVTLGKRHILFEIGDTELICRRLEGDFLDYKKTVPKENPITVTADTKEFIRSIDRVSVVLSEKLKAPVRCIFDQNRVYLSAKTPNGEAKDVCRIDGDGKRLEIGFNNRYLMDALRYAPADTVRIELNTGISPALVLPENPGDDHFLYMVLPVRLKAVEV